MDDREIHIDLHLKIIANKGIREGNGTGLGKALDSRG